MTRRLPSPDELARLPTDGRPDYNRLVFEKSPYLLQHAANPIDWFSWGEAAFEKARRENKPVFLSIGYSTCHWCHVMERESFEDGEVAEFMNRHFVPIKVDREEREDVDKAYMSVCVAMTGAGGWPLTIVMTPEKKPFFAGTYFPKSGRYGRPGLLDVLRRVAELWEKERDKLLDSAEQIVQAFGSEDARGRATLDRTTLQNALMQFQRRYDSVHGGFGNAPKFPSPHNLSFLLRTGKGLDMVKQTLTEMRLGGIFDHVGFGFHRYSTDRVWLLPHFEKMLYDQAMLTIAYVEAFLATREPFFARVARETIEYVRRDMTSAEGAFFSAEDADSEGEEGRFYLWEKKEFVAVAGEAFADPFGVVEGGNFRDQATGEKPGTNILYLRKPMDDPRWEGARQKLFEVREKRVHPHKDDKILTSWNGLMIAALAKASSALDEPAFARAAERAADFLLSRLRRPDGRLLRRYRLGEAAVPAFADDYAFLAWGLLELYQATFDARHLREAIGLTRAMLDLFWDKDAGGFFFEAADGERLFVRQKDFDDGAVPSGNSVAALNLLRLAHMTGDETFRGTADRLLQAASTGVAQVPMAYAQMLIALDFALGPVREIVISDGAGAEKLVEAVRRRFLPRAVVLRSGLDLAPFTLSQTSRDGRAAAYVCEDFACRLPTADPEELARVLDA